MEKVRGIERLPIFPLPVVLFPGVPMPLHIFEIRYRQMLDDIRVGNNIFGLSFFDSANSELDHPPVGHVGCAAEVRDIQSLPEGRSNIFTVGLARFRIESFADEGDPYLVAAVSFFEDATEDDEVLGPLANNAANMFMRIARAVSVLSDARNSLPDLPETDPQQLSFFMTAAVEMEMNEKQELLEIRHTSERLIRLITSLSSAVESFEERARMHGISRGNGHSGKRVEFE